MLPFFYVKSQNRKVCGQIVESLSRVSGPAIYIDFGTLLNNKLSPAKLTFCCNVKADTVLDIVNDDFDLLLTHVSNTHLKPIIFMSKNIFLYCLNLDIQSAFHNIGNSSVLIIFSMYSNDHWGNSERK